MEAHNNPELVVAFLDLPRAEAIHRHEIGRLAGEAGVDAEARAGRVAKWNKGESQEEVDAGAAHYLMTSWHALHLALKGEQRALAFFNLCGRDRQGSGGQERNLRRRSPRP